MLGLHESFFHFDGLKGLLDDDKFLLSLLQTLRYGLLGIYFCQGGISWLIGRRLS